MALLICVVFQLLTILLMYLLKLWVRLIYMYFVSRCCVASVLALLLWLSYSSAS